jgi:hypothetical protein
MTEDFLPYFGEIDLASLDECYDVVINLNGSSLRVDINFEQKSLNRNELDTAKNFLDNISKFDRQNKSYIDNDFKENGETSDYINFYFDELNEDELSDILDITNTVDPKERQFLNKLKLIRVGIYPDSDSEYYGVFDYSININGKPGDLLLVIKTDEKGDLDHITSES